MLKRRTYLNEFPDQASLCLCAKMRALRSKFGPRATDAWFFLQSLLPAFASAPCHAQTKPAKSSYGSTRVDDSTMKPTVKCPAIGATSTNIRPLRVRCNIYGRKHRSATSSTAVKTDQCHVRSLNLATLCNAPARTMVKKNAVLAPRLRRIYVITERCLVEWEWSPWWVGVCDTSNFSFLVLTLWVSYLTALATLKIEPFNWLTLRRRIPSVPLRLGPRTFGTCWENDEKQNILGFWSLELLVIKVYPGAAKLEVVADLRYSLWLTSDRDKIRSLRRCCQEPNLFRRRLMCSSWKPQGRTCSRVHEGCRNLQTDDEDWPLTKLRNRWKARRLEPLAVLFLFC